MGFTCVDLFCGAGGLSWGFRQAGFDVLAANDVDAVATDTYAANHPGTRVVTGEIERVSASALLEATQFVPVDCLIGGPPCQAFSVYNHQRGLHDDRSKLFRHYLRVVEEINPRWVVIENVTGMTSVADGLAVTAIVDGLKKLSYQVETKVLKAEEYGVPQERRRLFFIGNRVGLPIIFPTATFGPGLSNAYVSLGDAIMDLPRLAESGGSEEMPYTMEADSNIEYQEEMRRDSLRVFNHVAPRLAPINLARLKHIPEGGSWRDIPEHLLPAGMKRARRSDHTKRYGRPSRTELSCTVLTKCDPHWGAFFHPTEDRGLTVREAARLQSFPDRFRFHGTRADQYRQVGNAVPPRLAEAVARGIAAALDASTVTNLVTVGAQC